MTDKEVGELWRHGDPAAAMGNTTTTMIFTIRIVILIYELRTQRQASDRLAKCLLSDRRRDVRDSIGVRDV